MMTERADTLITMPYTEAMGAQISEPDEDQLPITAVNTSDTTNTTVTSGSEVNRRRKNNRSTINSTIVEGSESSSPTSPTAPADSALTTSIHTASSATTVSPSLSRFSRRRASHTPTPSPTTETPVSEGRRGSLNSLPNSPYSTSGVNVRFGPSITFTMGENARLEEKLRQFKNEVKNDDSDDTRGTYSPMSELDKQRRRNLIFDEERFEETFLKCLICREVYNEVDKLPKMLHCHHTFCLDCLYQMYRVEGEFRQSLTGVFRSMPMTVKIQCPTCREGIIISESELRRLPNDHTIMELLCFVSQTGKNEVQYCSKHQMQPLNFFCEPCIMPVCCDCTVIDHKESKGHVVVNVDEAMRKYTPIVEETLGDIKAEKVALAEKREAIESAQEDLDQIQKDLTTQIRAVFDSIRDVLDDRERELHDVAETEIERKKEILEGHMKVLVDRESQLNSEFNELQKAKDEKDVSLLFTGHKSAQDVLSKEVNVPTNSTKGFSVTFQFSGRSDAVIKQQLANLGDIIFQC